jgi:hypothetical protein
MCQMIRNDPRLLVSNACGNGKGDQYCPAAEQELVADRPIHWISSWAVVVSRWTGRVFDIGMSYPKLSTFNATCQNHGFQPMRRKQSSMTVTALFKLICSSEGPAWWMTNACPLREILMP